MIREVHLKNVTRKLCLEIISMYGDTFTKFNNRDCDVTNFPLLQIKSCKRTLNTVITYSLPHVCAKLFPMGFGPLFCLGPINHYVNSCARHYTPNIVVCASGESDGGLGFPHPSDNGSFIQSSFFKSFVSQVLFAWNLTNLNSKVSIKHATKFA